MVPTKRFPDGPITPHGAYHILHDRIPQMGLRSFDNSVVFNMMGGLAIPDRVNSPGRADIKDLKGLIAPWRAIDQKGATEDGVTFVDALYDPIMVELEARIKGKNPADCRRVYSTFIDSLDAKQQSTLFWFTHQMGYWWAPVRWFGGAPPNPVGAIKDKTQDVSLRLRADNGFWQSYPSVDEFVFAYESALDEFSIDDGDDMGTGWATSITGAGTGGVSIVDGDVKPTLANDRRLVARKNGYTSATDDQVVEIQIGRIGQWYYPTDANDHVWARMNNTGTPGTSGVKLSIRRHELVLYYVLGGVETVMRRRILIIPPQPGEKFRLVAGAQGDHRTFAVMRGGAPLFTAKEIGTNSPLGAANRSAGLGMYAADVQHPAGIRRFAAGDNATVTQSKFLQRINVGDQPMWDRYTCFGPGTFRFWNGPNAGVNEYVEFGALLPNQVMQLRTDPRKRGVRDMTVYPATPAQQEEHRSALEDFISFLISNSIEIVEDVIGSLLSLLGIGPTVVPPQGNPYSLLHGRWSKPIPAKSPGGPAQIYHVKVEIVGGNADSKIIAAGTPQRRLPY